LQTRVITSVIAPSIDQGFRPMLVAGDFHVRQLHC
jgi:hypothetical protein